MGDYIIHNCELYHWGIKGMKWGIRRYQNKDGSLTPLGRQHLAEKRIRTEENLGEKTIPKGTKMYRVTPDKVDGNTSKMKYVTYLDVDRDMYKNGAQVKSYVDAELGSRPYEHEFELKSDIRIPSLKTVREIEKRVVSTEAKRVEVAKSWIESMMMSNDGYSEKDITLANSIIDKLDRPGIYKELCKKYGDYKGDYYYYTAKQIRDAKEWIDTNDSLIVEQSLGRAHTVKAGVVKELQKLGYNAMYDNASIGVKSDGSYNKQQEGIEPLIIFDASKTMQEVNVRQIEGNEARESNDRYNKWLQDRTDIMRKFK